MVASGPASRGRKAWTWYRRTDPSPACGVPWRGPGPPTRNSRWRGRSGATTPEGDGKDARVGASGCPWDVIVVGARVAGSTLAGYLGKAGLRTLLVERARLPAYIPRQGSFERPTEERWAEIGVNPAGPHRARDRRGPPAGRPTGPGGAAYRGAARRGRCRRVPPDRGGRPRRAGIRLLTGLPRPPGAPGREAGPRVVHATPTGTSRRAHGPACRRRPRPAPRARSRRPRTPAEQASRSTPAARPGRR